MHNRPTTFEEFIGQPKAVLALRTPVKAAKKLGKQLAHVLLTGPAGLGKSTLGLSIIPRELGTSAVHVNCAGIDRPTDLLPLVASVPSGGVLFLDEIHALSGTGCYDYLLTLMEEGCILVKGADGGRPTKVSFPPFTVIGATTREGVLPEPLRDRFFHRVRLELYSLDDMSRVVQWHAQRESIAFEQEACSRIAEACHGTARWAVRLVSAVLDTAVADDFNIVSVPAVEETLHRLGFVNNLTADEIRYLQTLSSASTAVGVGTLSSLLDEEEVTIEEIIEPWLIQQGYILRTPQGRRITDAGKAICL